MITIKNLNHIENIANYKYDDLLPWIENSKKIQACFIGSVTGTTDWNIAFIQNFTKEGIKFASPKIFQYTTVASIAGALTKQLDSAIETRTFGDALSPLQMAIEYLKNNPQATVLYYTFEMISKFKTKIKYINKIKPGIAYCTLETTKNHIHNKNLPHITDFQLLSEKIQKNTLLIEKNIGAPGIIKAIIGIKEKTTLLYDAGKGNTALITIQNS